jgi:AraC family transcriptional regulator of adaptative response / DNA-3-methyladenine glycosylase II
METIMQLDPDQCYAIIQSRDARYDGRFFTGVTTTGIYCRPICPARTPHREHVLFFPSASAAAEAGFRPCLRCRPEASPGTPAWDGNSALVARALHLIEEGLLDRESVEDLAGRLHIGARQLRRLFREHLGASPLAVAQTRRVHFAKKLIDETTLPMTDIAFVAGFSSVRRFNAVIQSVYSRTPSELRRTRGRITRGDGIALRLAYRAPYRWDRLIGFLADRCIPGVEEVRDGVYRRAIAAGETAGVITVHPAPDGNALLLRVPSPLAGELAGLVERARRLFDVRADPASIEASLRRDPLLAETFDRVGPGLRVPGAWDRYETGVRAILGQQVSVSGATTTAGKLVRQFGERLPVPDDEPLRWRFPAPERLAEIDLADAGLMPRQRARAVQAFARAVADGTLRLETWSSLAELVDFLLTLPGIGPWTAQYMALRAFGEPDAFPAGDLGLRRALGGLPESEIKARAEVWRPWRGYATLLLWMSES